MAPQILANGSLLVDESVRRSAEAFIERAHDRNVAEATLTLDDGTDLQLDRDLAELVQFVLRALPAGPVSVRAVPSELTTTAAASILGVSRPTLMKMVEDGVLRAHRVGTHHRFAHHDVAALAKARQSTRQNAFVELRKLNEAL